MDNKKLMILSGLTILILLSICSFILFKILKPSHLKPTESSILLTVNGQKITIATFMKYYQPILSNYTLMSEENKYRLKRIKKFLLIKLIDRTLALQEISKQVHKKKSLYGQNMLIEIENLYKAEPKLLHDILSDFNYNTNIWKGFIKKDEIIAQYITKKLFKNILVEDKNVYDYYSTHKKEFVKPETVHLKQIVVSTEKEAQEIKDKIRKKICTFEDAARVFSHSSDKIRGGDMGSIPVNSLPPEFADAIEKMNEGEISNIIKTSYGYHLIKFVKKYPPTQISFQEAKKYIKRKLTKDYLKSRIQNWIIGLRKNAKVKINMELFSQL